MTDFSTRTAVVEAYIDGFARGDVRAISDLFADNATIEDPVGTELRLGREAIHAFYKGAVAAGAKVEMLGEPRCADAFVAFPFAVKLRLDGVETRIEVIDTFKFGQDEKITEIKAYWGPENMKPSP